MNKICTTIDQSKKLIELGIDVNTADMCYVRAHYDRPKSQSWFLQLGKPIKSDDVIGAWSLSALLELMPYPFLSELSNGIWKCGGYPKGICNYVTSESSLDAAFEMVCWLKENKKI